MEVFGVGRESFANIGNNKATLFFKHSLCHILSGVESCKLFICILEESLLTIRREDFIALEVDFFCICHLHPWRVIISFRKKRLKFI